jgi:hypothetical protein
VNNPLGIIKLNSPKSEGAAWPDQVTLNLGMSALAEVQASHNEAFNGLMSGVIAGMPDLGCIHALFTAALRRFHPDLAEDRYFVDDLIACNEDALAKLLVAASPDGGKGAPGKPKPKTKPLRR